MDNAFVNAVRNTPIRTSTTNGMAAFESTCRANVDLFGKLGASRGKDITKLFNIALIEDSELAIRTALWGRDVRSGAGERKLFRDILQHLETVNPDYLLNTNLLFKVPELGRWDDLLVFRTPDVKGAAFGIIGEALMQGNALCAKWMPRQGPQAVELRNFFGMSPKRWRKMLVGLTNVVETQMCNSEFASINFNHVPSLAMSRYTKAFAKRAPEQFTAWKEALKKGDPKVAKVNAGAVYPYDVIRTALAGDAAVANEQWKALPNYVGDAKVLPMVDTSASMTWFKLGGNLIPLDVAISLGLYLSDKNTGPFKDLFLTFTTNAKFVNVKGALADKVRQVKGNMVNGSTNLESAFKLVLDTAVRNNVPAADMPNAILILSDMQFNSCTSGRDKRALEMIRAQYARAGYTAPAVIFWNLNAHDNVPVKFDETGTALVSGFSPAIMKSVLSGNLENMTPEGIMRKTVMNERYDFR